MLKRDKIMSLTFYNIKSLTYAPEIFIVYYLGCCLFVMENMPKSKQINAQVISKIPKEYWLKVSDPWYMPLIGFNFRFCSCVKIKSRI